MSSCSAASRREAPPSTRAITRMRMSAEYAFGMFGPQTNQCRQTRPLTGPWEPCDSIRQEHALVSSVALLNGIAGAIFGIPTGLYMIWLGRRLRSPQAPALLPGHNEPIGALYLRPFQQEPRYFVYGDRKKYSAYYKQLHGGHRLTFFWRNVQHRRDVRTILSFRRGLVRWSIRCVGQSGGLHSARRCVSAVC